MSEVERHTGEVEGLPVGWRSAPFEGTPVLYLHGVLGSSLLWTPFLEATGGLALDLPGSGASVKAGTFPYSIAAFDGFIERFLDWRGIDSVKLVMHDFGAAGLAFAQRAGGRVESIVLINALALFEGHQWDRLARIWRTPVLGELWMGCLSPRLLRRALREWNAEPLPERDLRQAYKELDFGTQRATLRLYRSVRPGTLAAAGAHLGEIDAPALIVWGERDPVNPIAAAERYAQALGGESELMVLADAGHWPWLESQAVIPAVATFLARN
ncbi:MAG TPA: alpha/beta hydrolase [Solirubrobacteraceae bacterium]|jgi:pimeloyl-ACP methyl ester carboxylesterase|nr:alpha/beta hydrolase [Solirubrobacteraceae bacterium]